MAKASAASASGKVGAKSRAGTRRRTGESAGASVPPQPTSVAGRTLAEFLPLLPAETMLIKACRQGAGVALGSERPDAASSENRVRGPFIRFLALGGDEAAPVHESGVEFAGGFVDGPLNLDYCGDVRRVRIADSKFASPVQLRDTRGAAIFLSGCELPSLVGDGLNLVGDLYLDQGFIAHGVVRITGARIGGDLSLIEAEVVNPGGQTFCADRATISGGVFLTGAKFSGETRLLGVQIGGEFNCDGCIFRNRRRIALGMDGAVVKGPAFFNEGLKAFGEIRCLNAVFENLVDFSSATILNPFDDALSMDGAKFERSLYFNRGFKACGTIRLIGTEVYGDLSFVDATLHSRNNRVLKASSLKIHKGLFFRYLAGVCGDVALEAACVGTLLDDFSSWSKVHELILIGFQYERTSSRMTARERVEWLKKQRPSAYGEVFWPQPWEQLAKTLKDMGHIEDSKLVLIEKQKEMRRLKVIGGRTPSPARGQFRAFMQAAWIPLANHFARILHWMYGALAGYGYRPLRTLAWMLAGCLLSTTVYSWGEARGLFAPAAPILLINSEFSGCGDYGMGGTARWTRCDRLPPEYMAFDPFMYSLDVILPLVDLKQESDWVPHVQRRGGWSAWDGLLVRGVMWVEILFGWITSLLLVSAVGRLVQKD